MKLAETVTFGGSKLDRAAHLRGDETALRTQMAGETGRILPFWRGKPLLVGDGYTAGWIAFNHPLMAHAAQWCFLGCDGDEHLFAVDVSGWEPEGETDTVGAFVDTTEQHHPDLPDTHRFAETRAVMAHLSPRTAELVATAKAILGWHVTHQFCSKCGIKSVSAMAGWQRNCPSCDGAHFPRTDPVVIMLITHGNDVLLGRSPGWPEGMYSLLAGFIEPGETIEAAVRREVYEEARVDVGQVEYLASQPWAFPSSLMIGCHGQAKSRDITIDPVEIEEALWVPREELAQAMAGHHPVIKPARQGAIAHFILQHWLKDQLD